MLGLLFVQVCYTKTTTVEIFDEYYQHNRKQRTAD